MGGVQKISAGEALLHEPRHAPDVVEVGVGEDERADRRRVEGRLRPVAQAQRLLALEHPAVDQHPLASRLEEVLRPGDRLRRAQECQPRHERSHSRLTETQTGRGRLQAFSILRSTVCRMPPLR